MQSVYQCDHDLCFKNVSWSEISKRKFCGGTCARMWARVWVCARMWVRVCVCVRMWVRVWVCACARARGILQFPPFAFLSFGYSKSTAV